MSPFANEKALRRRMTREAKLAGLRLKKTRGEESGYVLIEHRTNFLIWPDSYSTSATAGRLDEVLRWIRERR